MGSRLCGMSAWCPTVGAWLLATMASGAAYPRDFARVRCLRTVSHLNGKLSSKKNSPTSWRQMYIQLVKDGQRCQISADELTALTFDFNYYCTPGKAASRCFRFGLDGQISGHPMGLTYRWRLENSGINVRLGPF